MPTETPWGQQAITYHAREDRRMLERLPVQPGVVGAGDLKVTPVSGLTVAVAAGDAWVAGSHAGVTRQGLYSTGLAASENVVVGAANATNPRIDQLVLRIRDTSPAPATAGDAENSGKLEIVAGTATAGATLDNRTGAAALPASVIRLADILVPAAFAGPFVQTTHLRDRRQWAHGALRRIQRTAANYTTTSTSLVAVDATNLNPRIECSGVPVRLTLSGRGEINTANTQASFRFLVDDAAIGAETSVFAAKVTAIGDAFIIALSTVVVPSAGSHKFGVAYTTTAGTLTVLAVGAQPLTFLVEELTRQDAENSGA